MKFFRVLIAVLAIAASIHITLPVQAEDEWLEKEEVQGALKNLISAVETDYFFDEKRTVIVDKLTSAMHLGYVNDQYQFGHFKRKLERMLYASSKDSRFEISWRANLKQANDTSDTTFPGKIETQLLDDGVGYLSVDGDLIYSLSQEELDKALSHLSSARALVIDLQRAGHIDFDIAKHFLHRFTPKGQPLATLTFANNEATYIISETDMERISSDIPVFIVTSPFVAGSWEFVAYTLKHEERAIIVGMPTMGLSVMTTTKALSKHVNVTMAFAELHHPVTGTNWRDKGVIPDIASPSNEATSKAIKLASDAVNAM